MEQYKIIENQAAIDEVYKKYILAPKSQAASSSPGGTAAPQSAVLDDDMLLAKIRASKQAEKFNALMNGDITAYPSQSEADMAFCGILAFWTKKNQEQIDRIFRRSGLYRQKWDERHGAQTYGERTISAAIEQTKDVYQGSPPSQTSPLIEEPESAHGGFLPPPPPVPLDVFPDVIVVLLREAADAFGVVPEIAVTSLLAFLSGLVGRSRVIRIKDGWEEAGNLWLLVVAKSGMSKTPCMSAFFSPVVKLETEMKKDFDRQYAVYSTSEIVYQHELKRYTAAKGSAKSAQQQGNAQPAPPAVAPTPPKKPRWRQVMVDDTTPEALGNILEENPKGVLWWADELANMILSLDRYVKKDGGTKSRLLTAHSSGMWKTNRSSKSGRNMIIPKACVGIFGGIQPGMLRKIFQGGNGGVDVESGFLQRFLPVRAIASAPSFFSERSMSGQSMKRLEDIAAALWKWDIEYDLSGNEIVKYAPVSDEAKNIYITWHNDIAQKAYISHNSAALKKAQAHALRLCLLLHCLDAALVNTDGTNPIPEDTMRRALRLMDWFLEHQRQCWALLSPGGNTKQADPLETAIMQAVVELAAAIERNGWKITNAEIFPVVKAKLGYDRVTSEAIGKAASRLGLSEYKSGNERGRKVSQKDIEKFQATVQPVPSVQIAEAATLSEADRAACEPPVSVQLAVVEKSGGPGLLPIKYATLEQIAATLPADIHENMTEMWQEIWKGLHNYRDSSRGSRRTA